MLHPEHHQYLKQQNEDVKSNKFYVYSKFRLWNSIWEEKYS